MRWFWLGLMLAAGPVLADDLPEGPPLVLPLPLPIYDEPFCRQIPGFSEDYVIDHGVSAKWLLTDCFDGKSAYIRIVDQASGRDLSDLMLRYRQDLLDNAGKPTFAEITRHMRESGAKIEYFQYDISPDDLKTRCTPVEQLEPCTGKPKG